MVSEETLCDHWQTYCAGAAAAGRSAHPADWCVSRNVFVADSTEEARRLARSNSLGRCIEYIPELTRRGPGVDMWKRSPAMSDAEGGLDYFVDEVVIAGDPPTVTQQINDLRARIGDFGTLALVAHDWDDKQRWARSLELFGSEVMPALTA